MNLIKKQQQDAERIRSYIGVLSGGLFDEPVKAATFSRALDLMRALGSSVQLNWGEDDQLWELSWITSGQRITAFSKDKHIAVRDALIKVEELVKAKMEQV